MIFLGADYYATGEGSHSMLYVVTGDDKEAAMDSFVNLYGGYMALGAEFYTEEEFLKKYHAHIPKVVKNLITERDDHKCHVNWYSQVGLNCS